MFRPVEILCCINYAILSISDVVEEWEKYKTFFPPACRLLFCGSTKNVFIKIARIHSLKIAVNLPVIQLLLLFLMHNR